MLQTVRHYRSVLKSIRRKCGGYISLQTITKVACMDVELLYRVALKMFNRVTECDQLRVD